MKPREIIELAIYKAGERPPEDTEELTLCAATLGAVRLLIERDVTGPIGQEVVVQGRKFMITIISRTEDALLVSEALMHAYSDNGDYSSISAHIEECKSKLSAQERAEDN
jgi:hypothetical protein